jgi:hypothetical protein
MTYDEFAGEAAPVAAPGGRPRTVLLVAVLGIVAAIMLGAIWMIAGSRDGVDLAAVEATSGDLVAELTAAETTAEVRAVAAAAAAHADDVQPALRDDHDPEMLAAQAYVLVWQRMAALANLSGATLDDWETARTELARAFTEVAEHGRGDIAAAGGDAVAAVDALVADARATLQAWELERDAALAAQERNAAQVRAIEEYRGAVRAQLALYASLRERTTAQVQPLYDPAVASEEVWAASRSLWQGTADREAIAAVLSGLVPPTGLDAEHTRVLQVFQDAVLAMRAALVGIDEAMAVRHQPWGYVPDAPIDVRAQPSWQEFSSESARLDQELPRARQALEDRAAALIAEYQQPVAVPPRPVV